MKGSHRVKALVASILVTAALSAPAVVMSSERVAEEGQLWFSGAALNVMEDGSVQAIFDVGVDGLANCRGTEFYLSYNKDYLTPSRISGDKVNEPLADGVIPPVDTDAFFSVDADLFGGETNLDGTYFNPFEPTVASSGLGGNEAYSYINDNYVNDKTTGRREGYIHMSLQLDQTLLRSKLGRYVNIGTGKMVDSAGKETGETGAKGKIKRHQMGQGGSGPLNVREVIYVMNHEEDTTESVTLGQLSFRVNKERLPEIVKYFDGKTKVTDPRYDLNGMLVDLIYVTPDEKRQGDDWALFYYGASQSGGESTNLTLSPKDRPVEDYYTFDFDKKTPIDARLANPEVTINAYQNYTRGTVGDVALSMGRYSAMATVTYADGSLENLIVPWGQTTVNGAATGYDPGLPQWMAAYDSTGSYKTEADGARTPDHFSPSQKIWVGGKLFPVPVKGELTVTPITLLDVAVQDQNRTYTLQEACAIENGEQASPTTILKLPTEARLITDVVPGGVSMVMELPGWSPTQPDSHWPILKTDGSNARTLMNTLKANSYSPATGTPYWPGVEDSSNGSLTSHPERFLGRYDFGVADSYGGTLKAGFTRGEIQAVFPWLTVPEDLYALPTAHRFIADRDTQSPVDDYTVSYVSTVTDKTDVDHTGNGQPTLTLSVKRRENVSMEEGSVFRVWLPNGQELGTGKVYQDIQHDPTTVSIEDWFDGTDGWYESEAVKDRDDLVTFDLVMNPGDPTQPETDNLGHHGPDRETLRRSINLGGWYTVSICEVPEDVEDGEGKVIKTARAWTDPIPVYVPPRRNEYTQDKTYNFLGENAELLKLFDPVGTTVTVPHGTYTAVNEKGLPLYVGAGNVATTDGKPDNKQRPTLARYTESYGLSTIYDGQTGAQPGVLHKFTVDAAGGVWTAAADGTTDTAVGGNPIRKYGTTAFVQKAVYEAFGEVFQPLAAEHAAYTGTLRMENAPRTQEVEKITLHSIEPHGITTEPTGDRNVTLATYNTVTKGYQSRQAYTFIITNEGTTEIHGLGIDGLTDGYPKDPDGGRFVLLQPPADYLAPGESTSFVLTYVYDLQDNKTAGVEVYRDTLYITSDRHRDTGAAKTGKYDGSVTAGTDYLLDFDAQFTVEDNPLHRVDLEVYPRWESDDQKQEYPMGTAEIILGVSTDAGGTVRADFTPAARNYGQGQEVFVVVEPKDAYDIASVTCVDASGKTISITPYDGLLLSDGTILPGVSMSTDDTNGITTLQNMADPTDPFHNAVLLPNGQIMLRDAGGGSQLTPYAGAAVRMDGTKIYSFTMPDYDTKVTVRFQESILSKLRIENMLDFSAGPNLDENGVRIPLTTDMRAPGTAGTADEALKTDVLTPTTPNSTEPMGGRNLSQTVSPNVTYKVWKKTYTTQDYLDAYQWSESLTSRPDIDLHLMTTGRALTYAEGGQNFDPSCKQYLVVIPYEADRSQVEIQIRKLLAEYQGTLAAGSTTTLEDNLDLDDIEVTMARYSKDFEDYKDATGGGKDNPDRPESPYRLTIYQEGTSGIDQGTTGGSGQTNSTHTSIIFDSPKPGESHYIRIRLVSKDSSNTSIPNYYYLEIRRAPGEAIAELHYGNSPYGMIMNDSRENDTPESAALRQKEAKKDFRKSYSFAKMESGYVPVVVANGKDDTTRHPLSDVTYWREAWVKNGKLYEPESFTGQYQISRVEGEEAAGDKTREAEAGGGGTTGDPDEEEPEAPKTVIYEMLDDKNVYDPADNLDLNDHAFFAVLGEDMLDPGVVKAWDSSGRLVDLDEITVSAQVTLLDVEAATQAERFSGQKTATIDFGTAGRLMKGVSGKGMLVSDLTDKCWPVQKIVETGVDGKETVRYTEVTNIRPGRYTMVYHYKDFDGVSTLSVTRPFVVLGPLGDVNGDMKRDRVPNAFGVEKSTDRTIIENRVIDPLGYTVLSQHALALSPTESVMVDDYPYHNIFRYRVCDVNNDRNINNIDGNQMDANLAALAADSTYDPFLRFYDPVNYGLPIPAGG